MGKDSRRYNFELSKRDAQRIELLKAKTDTGTITQVLKDALVTYEAIIGHLSQGDCFLIRDRFGSVAEVKFVVDVAVDEPSRTPLSVVSVGGRDEDRMAEKKMAQKGGF